MKKSTQKLRPAKAIASLALIALLSGCEYDFVDPGFVPITNTLSYATDIQPIFDASCNMSGCHAANGFDPDLSAANSYNTLLQENLINIDNPVSSKIYISMSSGSMKSFATPSQANLILTWIKQGALNN
ncbi:MAG: hypothetical protein CVU14_01290 [Bacteroidetes bacterium HGW-Bacteroidetes-9]|jgi:hypothetical protein|nr:MAG: hypothetical protein CVU14_01290 [Bacteroidetes bacterium HGW-Bacteroidetes-9]